MKEVAINKAVRHNYTEIKKFEAGIMLKGSEVKSIKAGNSSIKEAYIDISSEGKVILKQYFIKRYETSGSFSEKNETRERELLLNKKEINYLKKEVQIKGLTIVPRKVLINNKGLVKLDIILGKGKTNYDKRHDLKEKTIKKLIKDY